MVVAVAWVAIDWWGRRSMALLILVIGFFGQWLPWAFSPRGTFIYHFLPAVPLGCMALAVVLTGAWQPGRRSRIAAAAYTLAVIATFAWFYPLYTAIPLSPEQFDLRMWLQLAVARQSDVGIGEDHPSARITRAFRTLGLAISSSPTATRKQPDEKDPR